MATKFRYSIIPMGQAQTCPPLYPPQEGRRDLKFKPARRQAGSKVKLVFNFSPGIYALLILLFFQNSIFPFFHSIIPIGQAQSLNLPAALSAAGGQAGSKA
ncbi:MAG: hypothetical protein AB9834_04195 [Lentimicrobium sp.]